MKTLCLIRHAKSSWSNPTMPDTDRPLDNRGVEDAESIALILQEKSFQPDCVLASPAVRATKTAEIIMAKLQLDKKLLSIDKHIYDAAVEDLLAVIQGLDKKIQSVLLVGHNPGLTWLANYLADDHVVNLPTCGTYCVNFDAKGWQDITTVEGKTLFVAQPKHEI